MDVTNKRQANLLERLNQYRESKKQKNSATAAAQQNSNPRVLKPSTNLTNVNVNPTAARRKSTYVSNSDKYVSIQKTSSSRRRSTLAGNPSQESATNPKRSTVSNPRRSTTGRENIVTQNRRKSTLFGNSTIESTSKSVSNRRSTIGRDNVEKKPVWGQKPVGKIADRRSTFATLPTVANNPKQKASLLNSELGKGLADRRETIGHRASPRRGLPDKRGTVSHRASPRLAKRRTSVGKKTSKTPQKRSPVHKPWSVASSAKNKADQKAAFGKTKPSTVTASTSKQQTPTAAASTSKQQTPTVASTSKQSSIKRRSYTLTPDTVQVLGVKRPHSLDVNNDSSPAKRRKVDTEQSLSAKNSVPTQRQSPLCTDEGIKQKVQANEGNQETDAQKSDAAGQDGKVSMREKLQNWRKAKCTQSAASSTTDKTDRFTGIRPANKTVQSQKPLASCSKPKPTATSRPSQSAGLSTCNKNVINKRSSMYVGSSAKTSAVSVTSNRLSYVPPSTVNQRRFSTAASCKTSTSALHGSGVASRPGNSGLAGRKTTVTPSNKNNVVKEKASSVLNSRRKSCLNSTPAASNKKADSILNRRKSYAMQLKERAKTVADHHDNTGATNNTASTSQNITQTSMDVSQKQIAVVEPQVSAVCTPPIIATAPKTPRTKNNRRSVRFLTPQTEALINITPDSLEVDATSRCITNTAANTPLTTARRSPVRSCMTPCSSVTSKLTPVKTPVRCGAVGTPRMTPLKKEMSMREKLDNWLTSHGKTPTRYKHLLCFGDLCAGDRVPLRNKPGGLSVNELANQMKSIEIEQKTLSKEDQSSPKVDTVCTNDVTERLEEVLSECVILLESDCPTETVSQLLTEICGHMEGAKQRAKYWICKAKIVQRTGDDSDVISVFEESVRYNAQPPEEVADALKEFVDSMMSRTSHLIEDSPVIPITGNLRLSESPDKATLHTPRKRKSHVQEENILTSSAIKYCYTETTPFFTRLHSKARRSHHTPRATITPVRRSTRLSGKDLPDMLRDHDLIIESLDSLPEEQKDSALFIPNRALAAELEEAGMDDSY